MDSATAARLIELNHEFYTRFGDSFSATRHRIQPGVRRAVEWLQVYPQVEDYLWHRLAYYRGLVQSKATLGKFLVGWIRRLELLREAALQQS